MKIDYILTLFSALSFFFFGMACLFSPKMKNEFIRYGLNKRRILTGSLQLAGATGLVLGYIFSDELIAIAATGLCILMFLGFRVRLKVKDSLLETLPSLSFALLNLYIAVTFILQAFTYP